MRHSLLYFHPTIYLGAENQSGRSADNTAQTPKRYNIKKGIRLTTIVPLLPLQMALGG